VWSGAQVPKQFGAFVKYCNFSFVALRQFVTDAANVFADALSSHLMSARSEFHECLLTKKECDLIERGNSLPTFCFRPAQMASVVEAEVVEAD